MIGKIAKGKNGTGEREDSGMNHDTYKNVLWKINIEKVIDTV